MVPKIIEKGNRKNFYRWWLGGQLLAISTAFRMRGASLKNIWPLDAELYSWSKGRPFTIGQSFENILIMGGTGSGKTSGSGRLVALSMLRAGYGGLVLTAKPDERAMWERYLRDAGRAPGDLCVIEPGGPHRLNVLDAELQRDQPGGTTHNVVSLLTTVMEKAQQGSESGGKGDDKFWQDGACQMLTNAVDLVLLATGRVTVAQLYQLINSAPPSLEAVRSEEWRKESLCFQFLAEAESVTKDASRLEDLGIAADYWLVRYPGLNSRTRSIFVEIVFAMLSKLMRGVARDLFTRDTTIHPVEAAASGKIVLVNLPVLQYREFGVLCQVLVKTAFQRAVLRRNLAENPRPVMLWSDEFQTTATSLDAEFLAVCRSSRVSCVFLTQNLGNVRAAMGGGNTGSARADGLLGNFSTRIFHANSCPVTNEWASSIIGKRLNYLANASAPAMADWVSSAFGVGQQSTGNTGFSESMDFDVQPAMFTKLRTGGVSNRGVVEAIAVQSGRVFHDTGAIWRQVQYQQQA